MLPRLARYKKTIIIVLGVVAALVVVFFAVRAGAPKTFPVSGGKEVGVWEWTPVSNFGSQDIQNVVNNAAAGGFTAIYLSIDDYLDINAMTTSNAKTQNLTNYENSINTLIGLAKQKGIVVDAEAGDRDWGEPQNQWKGKAILDFVASYNETHENKFRGVQYDVEPYLQPGYAANAPNVLTDYVSLVEMLVNQDKAGINLPLGIVVPYFYDGGSDATPTITIDGVTDHPYEQILRLLNELPNGRIIIMDYRNFTDGSDGAIAIIQASVNDADATNVALIIGQETGPATPSSVTFYGLSKNALFMQVGTLDGGFKNDKSYQGVAIDYLETYIAMEE